MFSVNYANREELKTATQEEREHALHRTSLHGILANERNSAYS